MPEAPVFIVGCPRSGTSLLRNLLRSHPRLSFPPESHWIPTLYRLHGDPADERAARRLAQAVLDLRYVRAWDLPLTVDDLAGCRSFAELVSRVFHAWAGREGKPRWGDKTPQYVREIPLLHRRFPDCRILHIFRDGRDVARSWVRSSFGPRNLYSAARGWKRMVSAGRRAGAALPAGTYKEVCYEALLARPEESMRRVCAFLGEDYTDAVLRPTPISDAFSGTMWKSSRMRAPEIDVNNGQKWKREMSPDERGLVEWAAGDLLAELGYEVEGPIAPRAHRIWLWHCQDLAGSAWKRVKRAYAGGRLWESVRFALAGIAARRGRTA